MYTVTAVYWILNLISTNRQVLAMVTSAQNLVHAVSCLPMDGDRIYDCAVKDYTDPLDDLGTSTLCAGSVALTVNVGASLHSTSMTSPDMTAGFPRRRDCVVACLGSVEG